MGRNKNMYLNSRPCLLNQEDIPRQAGELVIEIDDQIGVAARLDLPGNQAVGECIRRVDHVYVREGVCHVWMFNEPLSGWRDVRVSERRTAVDWAQQVKALVDDPRYAEVERITLLCDQLNTHALGLLYRAFDPAEALRIANRLELVHTPKHGSWLNIAECELSVLTRQCLSERIVDVSTIRRQVQPWSTKRNARQTGVDWQFTTDDARRKLKRLYPKVVE